MKNVKPLIPILIALVILLCGCAAEPEPVQAQDTDPTLPQEGEYLYKALDDERLAKICEEYPESVTVIIDRGGARSIAEISGDDMDEFIAVFTEISIGKETQEWVSDNYNSVSFNWGDGTCTWISLNLKNLELNAGDNYHIFELNNFDGFWAYANSNAVPEE